MKLLQALSFQLVTCSPYRCLLGLMQDLTATLHDDDDDDAAGQQALQALHVQALAALSEVQCTDAPFLFSPQQIAVEALDAAIRAAAAQGTAASAGGAAAGAAAMRNWAETLIGGNEKLQSQVEAIRRLRTPFNPADEATSARLKDIDQRLKPVAKQVKAETARRERKAAEEAEAAKAKRKADTAPQRAEAQRMMQQKLAEALAFETANAGDDGFSIKRRKVDDRAVEAGGGGAEAAVKEEVAPTDR